jgi:hypothetical protein
MKVGLDSKQFNAEGLHLNQSSQQLSGSGSFITFWLYGAVEPLTQESLFWQVSEGL